MKIEHATGTSIETDTLPDVDALLMEESKKLHALFAQYNRQLFLTGEMKASDKTSSQHGCVFYHIGDPPIKDSSEKFGLALNNFYGRLDGVVRGLSQGRLGIGHIPPPQVEPYPTPSES